MHASVAPVHATVASVCATACRVKDTIFSKCNTAVSTNGARLGAHRRPRSEAPVATALRSSFQSQGPHVNGSRDHPYEPPCQTCSTRPWVAAKLPLADKCAQKFIFCLRSFRTCILAIVASVIEQSVVLPAEIRVQAARFKEDGVGVHGCGEESAIANKCSKQVVAELAGWVRGWKEGVLRVGGGVAPAACSAGPAEAPSQREQRASSG
eukprot:18904-Rhodomonas_salina.2